ncbi:MAG TPA: ferrous iron transport protein B, partial [Candidatus Saccharimonadales bacterium]|nr:ferrous iron transport protein B [Candidatus Saccharimonadales bacterium]
HPELAFLQRGPARPRVVLAGNPNVGKSMVFNGLSGLYADVSNFPGTTIEITRGSYLGYELCDTPGIYGVASFSEEERVARDILLAADVVLDVVDATHLERDLFLTLQLLDMGKKVVVLLNFMDEVRRHRMEIAVDRLAALLGVEVLPVVAVKRQGFERLEAALRDAREGTQAPELHATLHGMLDRVGSQAEALLVLEGDPVIAERHGVPPGRDQEAVYIERRNRVNRIVGEVLHDPFARRWFPDLVARCTLNPWTGVPLFVGALYLTYLFVGVLVAQKLVGFTEGYLGHGLWEPWVRGVLEPVVPRASWLGALLVGEFGVITMTTTYLVFLLLPLVAAFHAALSVMEDSGYLPRLATMVDRTLSALGLNGSAVIPLVLGFGCVTSATVSTRLLPTRRERTIATAILQFAIPCSAQLAVISSLLAAAGFRPMLVYSVVILGVLVAAGTILNRLMPGEPTPLLLDLPPMRLPRPRNVARKTALRTYHFMKEASGWFFVGALVVGLAQLSGALQVITAALRPITVHWLRLPPQASTAFVMGVVRRDFGAAGLYHMALRPMQVTVALITITLFVPCIASLMVMLKERGWREGLIIWGGTWVAAFAVGGLVAQVVG